MATQQQAALDRDAADVVTRALEHWGLHASSRTSGTGEIEVTARGIHMDGQPYRIHLTVEAEAVAE